MKIILIPASLILLTSCTSSQDKAKIRLAVSAYDRAADSGGRDRALMVELQKALDVVSDSESRSTLVSCQARLVRYGREQDVIGLSLQENLLKMDYGKQSSSNDAEAAMKKAWSMNPAPDPTPVSECQIVRLPKLGK